ncbi:MAG: hypothetical protein P8177_13600 [Gemmatimonadota bacterium]
MTRRLRAVPLLVALAGPTPGVLSAQAPPPADALTYRVRGLDPGRLGAVGLGAYGPAAPDTVGVRVIHGPRLTWVVDADRRPTLASARVFLDGHVEVVPGPGSLLLRGWADTADPAHTADVERVRGEDDRQIAGRHARHHTAVARFERTDTLFGERRRYRVTAHVWSLADLPFSWAPFAVDRSALPWRFPELREPLLRALEPLGAVARAVIEVETSRVEGGLAGPVSREVTGFEIDGLGRTGAPPVPGVVVERDIAEALQRLAERRPRQVCAAARDGDLPGVIESRIDLDTRFPLLGYLDGYCARR